MTSLEEKTLGDSIFKTNLNSLFNRPQAEIILFIQPIKGIRFQPFFFKTENMHSINGPLIWFMSDFDVVTCSPSAAAITLVMQTEEQTALYLQRVSS